MNVTSTAVSLTVHDVPAGAAFLARYLGFREAMAADGFASLVRDDTPDVILLRRGTEVLPHFLLLLDWSGSVASERAAVLRIATQLQLPGSCTVLTTSSDAAQARVVKASAGEPVYRRP